MEELIYSTQYIFQEYLQRHNCCFFNIPEYQRGYKWTADNVTQLLNDLRNFKKISEYEFYCLQNITLTKSSLFNEPCFNVIDGQQRLTTLFIILSYMQRNFVDKIIPKDSNILQYSIRSSTNDFLRTQILSGTIWDSEIEPNTASTKDQYYIMEVAKAVKDWFCNNKHHPLESTILYDLKMIVNEVDNGEEETVFASLNGGKVDLDGADLVRAILITRAAKQKYPSIVTHKKIHQIANHDLNLDININVLSQGKINEFRVKLGIELDKINLWWSEKSIRNYFEQLLPNRISNNKSFKYTEYPIDLLYYAFYEAHKERFIRGKDDIDLELRFFENGIDFNNKPGDEHLEFYNAIKEFHLTMVDWYNDTEIYNLIGYLLYNYKGNIISFEMLWKTWLQSNSKTEFKTKIKAIIRYQLAIAFSGDFDDKLDAKKSTLNKVIKGESIPEIEDRLITLRENILDISNEKWGNNPFTITFLPLLDILPFTFEVGKKKKTEIIRINSNYLKRINQEDKEHIRSQKRNFDEDKMTDEDREALREENRHGLNSIGNIVLLHESINRSYGNDKLIMKMVRIYSEHILDNEGSYIRPHTFNVFMSKMKNMEQNGISNIDFFWSDEDIKRTVKMIDQSLSEYLSFPEINNLD